MLKEHTVGDLFVSPLLENVTEVKIRQFLRIEDKFQPMVAWFFQSSFTSPPITKEVAEANARLYAAAPKILDALLNFCITCDKHNITELAPEYEQAMDAINLAIGKEVKEDV